MTNKRTRPAYDAGERDQLIGWLDLQRAIIEWKCEGVSDVDAHRPVLPSSPLMTMAGLVSHMRWTEHLWFEVVFLGGAESDNPQFIEAPEDSDMLVDDVPLSQLVEEYTTQCARSNQIIAAHSLDDVSRHPRVCAEGAGMRWILLHMLEETARHAGHADAIRELLDGQTGYY